MIIENPEAFKIWLVNTLEPICDADPKALSKYVFALVKKHKNAEETRELMMKQLDIFLQQETDSFVNLLIKTVQSKEYIESVVKETKSEECEIQSNVVTEGITKRREKAKRTREEEPPRDPKRSRLSESEVDDKETRKESKVGEEEKKDVGGRQIPLVSQSSGKRRRCLDYDEKGFCMRGDLCLFDHGTDPVVLEDISFNHMLPYELQHLPMYQIPTVPSIPQVPLIPPPPFNTQVWEQPYRMAREPPPPRELINVPVQQQPLDNKPDNCCLHITRIPTALNTVTDLNNHFIKFGRILNIALDSENSALITFSALYEAKRAYHCPEPVLGNRFIQVFWKGGPRAKDKVKETKTEAEVKESSQPQPATHGSYHVNNLMRRHQDNITKKLEMARLMELKKGMALKLSSELRERSQMLLTTQIRQQKQLIKKLEDKKLDSKKRAEIKATLRLLQESTKNIKTKLLTKGGVEQVEKVEPSQRTKAQIEKEMLDLELDLMNKKERDVCLLQNRLKTLQDELDRRTKKYKQKVEGLQGEKRRLRVWGFEAEQKQKILNHLQEYNMNLISDSADILELDLTKEEDVQRAVDRYQHPLPFKYELIRPSDLGDLSSELRDDSDLELEDVERLLNDEDDEQEVSRAWKFQCE